MQFRCVPLCLYVHTFHCMNTFFQQDHEMPDVQVNWTVTARSGPCMCTCASLFLQHHPPSLLPPLCILLSFTPPGPTLPSPAIHHHHRSSPPYPLPHPLLSKQWSMTLSARYDRPHRRAILAAVSTGTPLQTAFCRMSLANGKMTRTKCAVSI